MTNVELVRRKLAQIDEHVRRLKARRPTDVGAFRTDPLLQDAVALGVLVVVQEAVDIALHIASDESWEMAPSYDGVSGCAASSAGVVVTAGLSWDRRRSRRAQPIDAVGGNDSFVAKLAVVVGYFSGTTDLGVATPTSKGDFDIFVVKLAP